MVIQKILTYKRMKKCIFVLNNIHNQLESTLEMNTDVEVLSNTREGKRLNTLSQLFIIDY